MTEHGDWVHAGTHRLARTMYGGRYAVVAWAPDDALPARGRWRYQIQADAGEALVVSPGTYLVREDAKSAATQRCQRLERERADAETV